MQGLMLKGGLAALAALMLTAPAMAGRPLNSLASTRPER